MHSIRDTISFDHKKKEEPPRTLKLPKTVKDLETKFLKLGGKDLLLMSCIDEMADVVLARVKRITDTETCIMLDSRFWPPN